MAPDLTRPLVAVLGVLALGLLIASLAAATVTRRAASLRAAARWLGIGGGGVACLHAGTAFLLLLDAGPGHLWVQSYLRLGVTALLLLLAGLAVSAAPERALRGTLWKPVLLSLTGFGTLLAAGHALLAPNSSVLWSSMALIAVGLLLLLRGVVRGQRPEGRK